MFTIRKSRDRDLEAILNIYASARAFMRSHGNPSQWGDSHPRRELIEGDIASGRGFVCEQEGIIRCVFFAAVMDELTYQVIEGHWLNERPYAVIHRMASDGSRCGSARFVLNWAMEQFGNVRIDTHADNIPMQNLLNSLNFVYCGIIHIEDGTPRLAYQKAQEKPEKI